MSVKTRVHSPSLRTYIAYMVATAVSLTLTKERVDALHVDKVQVALYTETIPSINM